MKLKSKLSESPSIWILALFGISLVAIGLTLYLALMHDLINRAINKVS